VTNVKKNTKTNKHTIQSTICDFSYGRCSGRNTPVRLDVKEEILILRSGIFRSMRRRHTQHHCHWPATAYSICTVKGLSVEYFLSPVVKKAVFGETGFEFCFITDKRHTFGLNHVYVRWGAYFASESVGSPWV